MPKFDVTEMRAHLKDYIKEINDLMTTEEDLSQYTEFCSKLAAIDEITDKAYKPGPDGNYPPLSAEAVEQIKNVYKQAIDQADILVNKPFPGPAGVHMRSITREMRPLLASDYAALNTVDTTQPTSLPELIGKARQQAVDLGSQTAPTVGGMNSTRQHIQVYNGESVESGYFTPNRTLEPERDYKLALDRLAVKYPAYLPLINELKQKPPAQAFQFSWDSRYELINLNLSPEDMKQRAKEFFKERVFTPLELDGQAEQYESRPDYVNFIDDLSQAVAPIEKEYSTFAKPEGAELADGANIDKRNVAVSRVAKLLGKGDLVAEARPMVLVQNGQAVSGTFMKEAYGENVNGVKEGDPILNFHEENMENHAVLDDISAAQAIDFICGNIDRHEGNFVLRFDPRQGENARLVGVTLIDNDMSFTNADENNNHKGSKFILPNQMGVIGKEFYESMKRLTTKEQLKLALADCGLSDAEIDKAWERKQALQAKIDADRVHFEGKPEGYTEAGRIRVVPDNQWGHYTMHSLAEKHPQSQFAALITAPDKARAEVATKQNEKLTYEMREQNRRKVLGLPPVQAQGNEAGQNLPAPPIGVVIGNGIEQDPDPLNINREDGLKLAIPPLANIRPVGGALSKRYPVKWMEGDVEKKGFITMPSYYSLKQDSEPIFEKYINDYPEYADAFRKLKDYYGSEDAEEMSDISDELTPERMKKIGFTDEETVALLNDQNFILAKNQLGQAINSAGFTYATGLMTGVRPGPNKRVDMRNVALSDIGESLGKGNIVAKSRPVQIESGGLVTAGVIMENIDGIKADKVVQGDPVALITADQAKNVYNTKEGLKSVADLQVVDYICLNLDRHKDNMIYQFEGLGTNAPKFKGVIGIDNDFGFGDLVPDPNHPAKNLPPLNQLKVVTEEMAAKLRDPQTKADIEAKMRNNGMTEGEITGAKNRLDAIVTAMDDGRIRVVPDDEWGKGENTFEKLAQGTINYFSTVHDQVIVPMADMAAEWNALPANQRVRGQHEPEPEFSNAVKVESFGDNYTQTRRYKEIARQAEQEFRKGIEETASHMPQVQAQSEKDMMANIKNAGLELYNDLDSEDHWYHPTSQVYKELKQAAWDLHKLGKKFEKKLRGPDDTLSQKDRMKLAKQFNYLQNLKTMYQYKKAKEQSEGREITEYSRRRLEKTVGITDRTNELTRNYIKTISVVDGKKSPLNYAQNRVRYNTSGMNMFHGNKLRELVAETIYYKAITQTDYAERKKGILTNAVQVDNMIPERNKIMNTPAFKRIASLPDSELRRLASADNGEQLIKRFTAELGRDKQNELTEQSRTQKVEEARQRQANANNAPQHENNGLVMQ